MVRAGIELGISRFQIRRLNHSATLPPVSTMCFINTVSFAAAGGKARTLRDDVRVLVGEVDGQGFGVGVSAPGVKPNVSTLLGTRKVKSRGKGKERDSAKSAFQGGVGQTDRQGGDDGQDRPQSPSGQSPTQRAVTPPPKNDAFEEFKQERGSEINRILNQNKGKCEIANELPLSNSTMNSDN